MEISEYRNLSHSDLCKYSVVNCYHDLLEGYIKAMPSGTWQKDEQVIILIRYVLEVRLGLLKEDIPKITRAIIKENRLWGALNRFKSIRRLIHFVYPGAYHECDFSRVPVDYWGDIERVKERFEWKLRQEGLSFTDISTVIQCDLLIKWGFSNPLKRHGYSPFRLLNAMYPNFFKETDFKKFPHNYYKDTVALKKQFLEMLQKEQICLEEVPEKVNRDMLVRHRFSGVLSSYSNSVSKLVLTLFPDYFSIEDFSMRPNGYWDDPSNVRNAIEQLLKAEGKTEKEIPEFLTKKRLQEAKLGGLLDHFHGSPIEIANTLYPGRFDITEFQRVPNKYWHLKENRIHALRTYCEKQEFLRDTLPTLNRAYFHKYFPRFISIADRYYDSHFYQWTIEAFPEHDFSLEEFDLLVADDGQICDSKEELVLHNFLIQSVCDAEIEREAVRFYNGKHNETYIPDWIIEQNGRKYIVEYFGLYGSNLYKGYTEKSKRKMAFYPSLSQYTFVAIFPEDFKAEGFGKLAEALGKLGIDMKNEA